ncbi:type I-E CRISPR-associated protein Cas5/CasD [Streptomyces sp. NRRL F-5123]|uniref:type I-E CRISPR-associated protein Cas5/CasD n=1 Tax=Streptomyces sp. NRRL F-5123 TaxID=1463856 RepID=UPI0004E13159|nr:type I-E CRISPR-associated protein Cas5/CasD [Streptomyces sp. NRRL F-5123]
MPPSAVPEAGLLLRLTGPLQSWGEHSHFNDRDTAAFPTRSGILGLLAAALGRLRTEPVDDLACLSVTIRMDRPGVYLRDLHTVGGGLSADRTVTTADGGKRPGDTGTLLSHRHYLADAAFTVAVTAPSADGDLLDRCADALRTPRWPLFLGRRACPPEGPLLLGRSSDALRHLIRLPLSARTPRGDGRPAVEFLSDRPLDRLPVPATATAPRSNDGVHPESEVSDDPVSFAPRDRAYRSRPLYRRSVLLPDTEYAGLGADALRSLARYLDGEGGLR